MQDCSGPLRPYHSAPDDRACKNGGGARPRRPAETSLEQTLIVGAGEAGKLLLHEMRRNRSWGFQAVAFVDDDPRKAGVAIAELPVVGTTAEISAIVARSDIRVVVIAIPSAAPATLARLAASAGRSIARVLTMPSLSAVLREATPLTALHSVPVAEVLGRPTVVADLERGRRLIAGRRVLITGAAGSIGHELTLQAAELRPQSIVVLDVNETGLFDLCQEAQLLFPTLAIHPEVASVTNGRRLAAILGQHQPEIVFHAAAYKHVPMMETCPEEAVMVNVVGTARVARAAASTGASRFVLVSTDKAVRPSSVMGATKRVAELAVKALARETGLSACCVRFGNVLASRGSVIPTFERQIDAGGPVTVTHPATKRFFMTIREAASLIIEAAALGDADATYILDMGEEVAILDLAKQMIRLGGHEVGRDIDIVFTGLRPGEKLREELALATEISTSTLHPKVRLLRDAAARSEDGSLSGDLARLEAVARYGDPAALKPLLLGIVADHDQPPDRPIVPPVIQHPEHHPRP